MRDSRWERKGRADPFHSAANVERIVLEGGMLLKEEPHQARIVRRVGNRNRDTQPVANEEVEDSLPRPVD